MLASVIWTESFAASRVFEQVPEEPMMSNVTALELACITCFGSLVAASSVPLIHHGMFALFTLALLMKIQYI